MYIIIKLHEGEVHRADITVNRADCIVQTFESKQSAQVYLRTNQINGIVVEYKKPEAMFHLWGGNRLDQEWIATEGFLKSTFSEYLEGRPLYYVSYYGEALIMGYINGDKDHCLNSTCEAIDVRDIHDLLRPVLKEHLRKRQDQEKE